MAENTNTTRRNLLKGAPALAVALAIPTVAAAGTGILASMIAAHRAVYADSDAAWLAASELEDQWEYKIPLTRVQYGSLIVGRDDDGNDVKEPLYASCEAALIAEREKLVRVFWTDKQKGGVRKRYDRLMDELRALKDQRKAIEDQIGLTAALDKARALSNTHREMFEEIEAYVPVSLDEVRVKVSYMVEHLRELNEVEDETLDVLSAVLGKAVA